jgi:3-hydroxyisobutyrate dehydrogenase-like beta-hydroxyacid dehydrogenase
MGGRMTHNLLRARRETAASHGIDPGPYLAFDLVSDCIQAAAVEGATPAESAADVARRADIVMCSLPSSDAFVSVAEGDLLPNTRPGQVVIEFGTTTPPEQRRLAALFAARGASLIDAPVSGWITGAETGTLFVFLGGDPSAVERCRALFAVVGDPERTTYCGAAGQGQVVKGVNQLLSGLVNGAYLEILAFAANSGVDPAIVRAAMGTGGARKQDFDRIAAEVARGGGDSVGVKFRELPYYLQEATAQGGDLPLTRALYKACDAGERIVIDDNRPAPAYWNCLTGE